MNRKKPNPFLRFNIIKLPSPIKPESLKIETLTNTKAEMENHNKKYSIQAFFKTRKKWIKKLDKIEVIIVSIILGMLLSLALGNILLKTHYYRVSNTQNRNNIHLIEVHKHIETRWAYYQNIESYTFNYLVAISAFIIGGGLIYLFLKKINENKN